MSPRVFDAAPAQQLLQQRAAEHELSVVELADILGIPRRTLLRVMTRTELRWDTADRIAIALGYHPIELWPSWHHDTKERTA
jgi:lambda repressor-like predicted transcriptional regulator